MFPRLIAKPFGYQIAEFANSSLARRVTIPDTYVPYRLPGDAFTMEDPVK